MPLHLFEGFGIEIEYMIVSREDLSILPISDQLLNTASGGIIGDVEFKHTVWSNELVLHVIEIKTNGPVNALSKIAPHFQNDVCYINEILKKWNACLLPTGAHPLMNPDRDTKLWPHDYNAVYEAYHRIFNCKGHGWSNVQSTHLNLPFGSDDEFSKLHNAIRLLLPIIPALSASSPILDGRETGMVDARLKMVSQNQARIPSIAGSVIPENIGSRREYEEKILAKIYRDIAPYDTDDILKHEWLNSRGAIARFDRDAIEIRIIDAQECPLADIAICRLIVETLKALIFGKWSSRSHDDEWSEGDLAQIYNAVIHHGGQTMIRDQNYLALFGCAEKRLTVRELWDHIFHNVMKKQDDPHYGVLETIINQGSLSERIIRELHGDVSRESITRVYRKLANCLHTGNLFY